MRKQTHNVWLVAAVLVGLFVSAMAVHPASAAVGINQQMALQGKIVLANGTNIANGTYNVEYKIYSGGTSTGGGTLQWTEDYLIGSSGGVTVTNGIFSVNLGAVTSLSTVDFNSDTLWLSIQVGNTATCTITTTFQTNCAGDGEMTPYIRLTSVPYAFNANKVGGLTASQLVQLSPGTQQSGFISVNGAGTFGGTLAVASLATLSGGATLAANQNLTLNSGSGSFVQGYLSGVNGSAQSSTVTNSNASATVAALNAHNIALIGGANTNAGANVLNGLNFATVTPVTNNAFYGLNFGTGYNDLLRYNGTQLISGTGIVQPAAINGAYANITGTGALASGSIASGFGTISTAQNITTSTTLQGATLNATTGLTLAGVDINTAGTLTNVAYHNQANTFSAANAFNGSTSVTNNLTVNTGTANQLLISSGTNVPTTDQLSIDNTASTGVAAAGVNGANIKYKGGTTASIEASGMRVDYTPGTGASSVWNGVRIVATTAAATGVTANGIKLDGPASAGVGTDKAIAVGTGWDIGLDVQSGGLQLAALASNPTIPAAGNLRAYAYKIAGRTMLKILSPSGVDYALQPSLAQQSIFLVTPGTGTVTTTYSATGGSVLAAGTLNAIGGVTTEAQGFMGNIVSAATAGTAAGVSNGANQYYTGSIANGANGFFYFARISLPDVLAKYNNTTTGSRLFFGLSDQTLATMVASDAPAGNYAGIQYSGVRDTGGLFQFTTKNGTTQTVQSTGVTLAVSKTYDIYIYVAGQGTTINWRIDNLTDGTAPVEGSQTLTLPTSTVALKSMIDFAPLEAVAHNLRFQRLYVETDR